MEIIFDKIFNMKKILFILLLTTITMKLFSQENQLIPLILNKEIHIDNNWTGQSLTLIKENNNYFLLRKQFGSGVPIVAEYTYDIKYKTQKEIETGKIIRIVPNNSALILTGKSLETSKLNNNDIYTIKLDQENKIVVLLNNKQIKILE